VRRPARIYDLRSTFASDALAAGVSAFELARIMGTSVQMIERHYGALLDGAGADIARRLDAYDANTDRGQEEESAVMNGEGPRLANARAPRALGTSGRRDLPSPGLSG
jgi:hypothetical protein